MTLFASFVSTHDAQKAAAALLDQGAKNDDLSIVSHESGAVAVGRGEGEAEETAKHGVTTTTGADAAYGAAKGLTFGAGLAMLGVVATALIPGVGVLMGAGAVATAIFGSAAAGAAAGGVVGYLKDQGMNEEVAAAYHARVAAGGAILALNLPSGRLDEAQAEALMVKYEAAGVFTSYPSETSEAAALHDTPMAINSEPLEHLGTMDVGSSLGAEVPVEAVTPTRSDPSTGLAQEGYVEDLATGTRRRVRFEHGRAYYVEV